MDWIIPANKKVYDHAGVFNKWGFIERKQNVNYTVGDIVYIYCSRPYMKIMYKTQVEEVKLNFNQIVNDEEFWVDKSYYNKSSSQNYVRLRLISKFDDERLSLNVLKQNGLKGNPQRAVKIKNNDLKKYIEEITKKYELERIFPESDGIQSNIYEGAVISINVNRYE